MRDLRRYAAIEVLRARADGTLAGLPADPSMDAYSLGLLLAQLLSPGCRPPFGDDAGAMEAAGRSEAPPIAVLACTASKYA